MRENFNGFWELSWVRVIMYAIQIALAGYIAYSIVLLVLQLIQISQIKLAHTQINNSLNG